MFQFTHPFYLLLLLPALGWMFWLALKSDVQISAWRRWAAVAVRTLVIVAIVFAVAGLQWLLPVEGMNVFYLLDRSDSIPAPQQDLVKNYVNQSVTFKRNPDKAGIIVFGSQASLEPM